MRVQSSWRLSLVTRVRQHETLPVRVLRSLSSRPVPVHRSPALLRGVVSAALSSTRLPVQVGVATVHPHLSLLLILAPLWMLVLAVLKIEDVLHYFVLRDPLLALPHVPPVWRGLMPSGLAFTATSLGPIVGVNHFSLFGLSSFGGCCDHVEYRVHLWLVVVLGWVGVRFLVRAANDWRGRRAKGGVWPSHQLAVIASCHSHHHGRLRTLVVD